MYIEHNSRQIPSDKRITANKQYSDILYGYLQHISDYDEEDGKRYINKLDINFSRIGEELDISRQTVSKKFNMLLEEGLLYYELEKKRYVLSTLEKELATLLPDDTIRVLCNTLRERSLSILAYLLKTYVQHGEESCEVNLDIIKDYVGLNVKNRGTNNEVVRDVFLVLKQLGLIRYHTVKKPDEKTGGYKTYYMLDSVDNRVRFFE